MFSQFTIQDLGSLGEFVGAMGVIVSLVYLARQMHQNTTSVRAASFNSMVQNNRISTEANQFITAMNLARSEAIKRRANIDVVATDASDSNNEWGKGWSVAVNGGATLRTFPAMQGGLALYLSLIHI